MKIRRKSSMILFLLRQASYYMMSLPNYGGMGLRILRKCIWKRRNCKLEQIRMRIYLR